MTRLFYLLNQAQGQLYKLSDHIVQTDADISINQSAVLLALDKEDGVSLSQLREQIRINKSSMGALVERMIKADLIIKKTDADDSRVSRVFIETKGKAKIDVIKSMLKQQNTLLTDGFTTEELATVTRFLQATIEKTLQNK